MFLTLITTTDGHVSETAIVDFRLPFADQGKQTSVSRFQQANGSLPFPFSVSSVFRIHIHIYICINLHIHRDKHIHVHRHVHIYTHIHT